MCVDGLVSMVIVNFNSGSFLSRCLDTVAQQTYPNWEVIVVDNDSRDGSLEATEGFERVTVVRNDENRGFAAAQNQGIRLGRGKYLMPLNFDIEMTPRFLEEMVATIELSPTIGTVCGKLMRMAADGERTDRFYSTGHVLPPNRFVLHRGFGQRDRGQYDDMCNVFGASGAAPLYRREMLDDIAFRGQFFDESLFTWYEDVDLDWRAARLGWRCVYAPTAVAYHVGHPEGHGGDPWQVSKHIRNRWLVILANDDLQPIRRETWAMLKYEWCLLRYVLTDGHCSAYCRAVRGFLKLLPTALAKRRWLAQRRAAQSDGSVCSCRQGGQRT